MKIRKLIALLILLSFLCSACSGIQAETPSPSEGAVDYQLSFEEVLAEINANHKAVIKPESVAACSIADKYSK